MIERHKAYLLMSISSEGEDLEEWVLLPEEERGCSYRFRWGEPASEYFGECDPNDIGEWGGTTQHEDVIEEIHSGEWKVLRELTEHYEDDEE